MSWKDRIKELKETNLPTLVEDVTIGRNLSPFIEKVISINWIMSLCLLFMIPYNGIIFYRTVQSVWNLPNYSNIVIGLFAFTLYIMVKKLTKNSEDTLYEIIVNKIISFSAMFCVFVYFTISLS